MVNKHCYHGLSHRFRSSLASIRNDNDFQNSAHSTIYIYKIILIKVMNSHVIKKESVMQRKFYMIFMVLHLVILDAGVS